VKVKSTDKLNAREDSCSSETEGMDNRAASSRTTCLLLGLPRELRDKIYRYLLVADNQLKEVDADNADDVR
jgi:hypothetical protein